MRRKQNGFSMIEGLLILVIMAIIGFTGWYVYHSQHNADNSYSNSVASSSQVPATSKTSNAQPSAQKLSGGCILDLTVGRKEGAAGTFHEDLIFTNKDKADCTLNGYPTVTLLDSGGYQIGQAAAHDTSVSAASITIKPNESAYAGLSLPDPDIAANCSSTISSMVQATVPGQSTETLRTTDTSDYYCPDFMVRPFQASPSN